MNNMPRLVRNGRGLVRAAATRPGRPPAGRTAWGLVCAAAAAAVVFALLAAGPARETLGAGSPGSGTTRPARITLTTRTSASSVEPPTQTASPSKEAAAATQPATRATRLPAATRPASRLSRPAVLSPPQALPVPRAATRPAARPALAPKPPAPKPPAPKTPPAKRAPVEPPALMPQPTISYIFPAGGQRGTTVEATVGGLGLFKISEVRVGGGGLTAKVARLIDGNTVALTATVAPDAECGLREIRLMNSGGLSNRIRFAVGQVPEIVEKESNSRPQEAQPLPPLPVTVNGQIHEGDRDCFRFAARAGQTIVCEVQARALIPFIADGVPGWNDVCLTLFDAEGSQMDSVDDFRLRPDPVLVWRIPRDGEYIVEVHDILFRGRADFVYRLSIGEMPYLTHIFPLGGRRGSTVPVALFGANLPATGLDVAIPTDSPFLRQVAARRNGIASNAVPFAAGDDPEQAEAEGNDAPASANRVEPPVIVNGRIDKPGDSDCFGFRARAGEKLVMEVQARRLESPLDSLLTLTTAKGVKLVENDDWTDPAFGMITHHADSRLIYSFTAEGEYILRLRDIQGKGGQEYAYRLLIAPPRPDFLIRVSPDNPRVGQGETVLLTVNAIRRDGFDGEIALSMPDAPSGFIASQTVIPAGQDVGLITLTVPANVPLGVLSPTVVGKAVLDKQPVVRKASAAETVMQAFSYTHVLPTEEFVLTIVEATAFSLAWENLPAALEIPQNGELALTAKVIRREGVRGGINLKVADATSVFRTRSAFIAADKDTGAVVLTCSSRAVVGQRYSLVVMGSLRLSAKDSINRVLPALSVRIGPPLPAPPAPVTAPASTKTAATAATASVPSAKTPAAGPARPGTPPPAPR